MLLLAAVFGVALGSSSLDDPAAKSAATAASAAVVANTVATSAQQLAVRARQTLVRAHAAIEKVRSTTAGMSEQQQGQLAQAERSLAEATRKVEFEQLEQAEWLTGVAADAGADTTSLDALEVEVGKLEKQLGGLATEQERAELEGLKAKVGQGRADAGAGAGAKMGQLQDKLSAMRRQLDAAADIEALEAALEGGDAKDVAPSDINKLRAELDDLQKRYDTLAASDDIDDDEVEKLSTETRKLQSSVANEVLKDDDAAAVAAEETTGDLPASSTPRQSSTDPDVDMQGGLPYGELEPFGREDTGQELTDASIRESDLMVDQLEKAQVAETKRAVFRALTRLRGAAISSFDGIARAQTGNIDEYAHTHKWRDTHPLHHLAAEEGDVSKWAFPANADVQVGSVVRQAHSEPATGRSPVSELLQG